MDNKSHDKRTPSHSHVNVKVQELTITINHGENVRYYRNAKGYSQEYVASQLNISQQKYSEMERSNTIDQKYLTKLGKLFNLGTEWFTDIPVPRGTTSYHQDGNGNTNFQNTGDVNYNINNPIEQIVLAYQSTVQSLTKAWETDKADKKEAIELERNEKQNILDKFVAFVENQKK